MNRSRPSTPTGAAQAIRQINAAYRILLDYSGSYRHCFSETELLEQVPEERPCHRFGRDPLRGGKAQAG